jgi:hypothetical protein
MRGRLQISDDTYLRLLGETDARELHGLIEANRTYLARWLPWAASQTFEDTLDFNPVGQRTWNEPERR